MLRQSIVRSIRSNNRAINRPFSVAAVRMAEGDTGAPRSGGSASSDAFTKREHSEELRFIKDKEREKLLALKAKLQAQRQHLDELDKHIDELSKESGGEQN